MENEVFFSLLSINLDLQIIVWLNITLVDCYAKIGGKNIKDFLNDLA